MQTDYVTLRDGSQVHYRQLGNGPPMILLHPSPQCSAAMLPAITAFSAHCACHAIDTPGYGLSDPLPTETPGLADFADRVIEIADALGMAQFYLYGAATGAQIAIEIGKRHPDRVALVMLDSNGHMSESERARMMEGYFPDVTPRRDGGHLLTYWDMCRQLFFAFPWQSGRLDDRLNIPQPPPEMMQAILLRYLRAGSGYAKAYKPAFRTENIDHLNDLRIPGMMMRWEGSIALGITDAMIAQGLPDNIRVLEAGPPVEQRYGVQAAALAEAVDRDKIPPIHPPEMHPAAPGKWQRVYLQSESGISHAHSITGGSGTPLVLLHDALESSRAMMSLAEDVKGERPMIAIDLPGHGASPPLSDDSELSIATIAQHLAAVIRTQTDQPIEIVGRGLGGAIAAELSHLLPVEKLQLVDPIPYRAEEQASYTNNGMPDLSPRRDGTHLIQAWYMVRDSEQYWPWFDTRPEAGRPHDANLNPETLHAQVCDLLRVGSDYRAWVRLTLQLDWAQLLADVNCPVEPVFSARYPCPDRQQEFATLTAS